MNSLPPLFAIERILPYCTSNALILTPNNRLRSKILQAWGQYQQAQGHTTWQAPRVESLEQWFSQQWEKLQSQAYPGCSQTIANSEQQRVLWESITATCGLMQTEAIAQQAATALRTLARWNLNLEQVNCPDTHTPINETFVQWSTLFQQRLQALNSITQEESYQIIGTAFDKRVLPQEKALCLLGFDDIAPLFLEQLNKACEQLIHLPPANHQPQSLQRCQFDTMEQEMAAAARWSRSLLAQQEPVRIGIIVANLGQCRQAVERAFMQEFEAHSLHPDTERYTLPFNFSAGTPLGDTPLIAASLQLLKLQHKHWELEFIVQCLLSPFWGHYQIELEQRCALIHRLQSLGVFTITDSQLRYWAQRVDQQYQDEENTHSLFDYFDAFAKVTRAITPPGASAMAIPKQVPSIWVELFLQQLDALNWPGERTPDSQEYQQTQLWYQVLETFAGLDSVLGVIDASTAHLQLQHIANHTPFQPKVPDSPIQILGILEGAGLHFTHCWVMGLHQQAWPPAAAPNPLLPIRLQREHNMPHASSLRELEYAESLTENYRHCADYIIFSAFSHEDDSEQHLLASTLISHIPLSHLHTMTAETSLTQWQQRLSNSATLELVDCQYSPPFQGTQLPGGAGLFKAQSANPFDSFAKYRLRAWAPMAAVNGFSFIEKGNILHSALATIWKTLEDQAALLALDETALQQLIEESVKQPIADIQKYKLRHLSDTLCHIEAERQSHAISQWLDYEKKRAPFRVLAIEESHHIHFQGYSLDIRVDRVDQLADGQLLVIDYKTGEANINAWNGERPKDPQLPLYALCYPLTDSRGNTHSIKGISFAQVNINAQTLKGLAEADIAPGVSTIDTNHIGLPFNWEDALQHWQATLERLLNEFQQGDCSIHYRDNSALHYAEDYLRLNRFYEAEEIEQLITAHQESHLKEPL